MNAEEWKKGIEAWNRVKQQAEIDMEQADLYIEAIKNKMESLDMTLEEVK
jgi:hypothetical protein